MNRNRLIIFLIIYITIVTYLDYRIRAYDMRFYSGKDGGISVRLESIILLSALFFLLMDKRNIIFRCVIGLFVGLLSGILSVIIIATVFPNYDSYDTIAHYVAGAIIIGLFYLLRKRNTEQLLKK